LAITQEEADTRIILHALYSDKLYQENNVQGRIVVKAPDTDVLVPELINFFQSGITLPSIKCSENRLGSTVPFCLFDRVLNVISIKDIDDNGCKLKTGDYIAKHIRQNSSLQEGQSLYLAGLFSNPETVKMLNQNGMLDCTVVWQSHKKRRMERTVLTDMFGNVIAERSNNIFTKTNKLFPVRNNPTFNQMQ
jgi:hypothetical protein